MNFFDALAGEAFDPADDGGIHKREIFKAAANECAFVVGKGWLVSRQKARRVAIEE